jgi:putative membrane protein
VPLRLRVLLGFGIACAAISRIGAADGWVWAFELSTGAIALLVLALTWRRLAFTRIAYVLAGVYAVVIAAGAHYTYAGFPVTEWLRETLDLSRNHFDRVGHFLQGFVPAIFVREILIRTQGLRTGAILFVLVSSVCLAFSATYEILEMLVVIVFYPDSGPEWLGWQGDVWDAQWDMTNALTGSILCQLFFGRLQDRQIAELGTTR